MMSAMLSSLPGLLTFIVVLIGSTAEITSHCRQAMYFAACARLHCQKEAGTPSARRVAHGKYRYKPAKRHASASSEELPSVIAACISSPALEMSRRPTSSRRRRSPIFAGALYVRLMMKCSAARFRGTPIMNARCHDQCKLLSRATFTERIPCAHMTMFSCFSSRQES